MAAAPFVVTLNMSKQPGANAPVVASYTLNVSDVANAFAVNAEDGLAFIDLPRGLGALYFHPSTFASAAGTDTSQMQLFVGGAPTGFRVRNASLASAANVARIAAQGFRPGARLAFKQLA
jgi:hypothetical protein